MEAAEDVIFATKPGFIPSAHVIQAGEQTPALVLKLDRAELQLTFPACPENVVQEAKTSKHHDLLRIPALWAPRPADMVERELARSADTALSELHPSNSGAGLRIWSGIGALEFPDDKALVKSSEWTVQTISNFRRYTSRLSTPAQWRGTLRNGNRWRWIMLPGGPVDGPSIARTSIFYLDLPEQDASYFDKLLDQICEVPLH